MKPHYFIHRPDITSPRGTIWRVPGEHLESALSWQETVNSCLGAVMYQVTEQKALRIVRKGRKLHLGGKVKTLEDCPPARVHDWALEGPVKAG